MNISFDTATIRVTEEEARDIYYSVRSSILRTIKDHWSRYPDSYENGESRRLEMLTVLSRVTGNNPDWDKKELRAFLDAAVEQLASRQTSGPAEPDRSTQQL